MEPGEQWERWKSGYNKSQMNEKDENQRMRGVFHRHVFSVFFGAGWQGSLQ